MSKANELTQKGLTILEKHRADNKAGPLTVVSLVLDFILVLGNGWYLNSIREETDFTKICPLLTTFLTFSMWWIMGILVLSKNHFRTCDYTDNGKEVSNCTLTAAEAVMVLTQQFTSVGYGSHTPDGNDSLLQVWHGVHAWVGTALIGNDIDMLAQKALDCIEYMLGAPFRDDRTKPLEHGVRMFLNTIILVGFLFIYAAAFTPEYMAQDENRKGGQAFLESMYFTIFTGTTTGYGDLSPASEEGMGSSLVWMPLIVSVFNRFAALLGGDSQSASMKDWYCYEKKDQTCLVAEAEDENEEESSGNADAETQNPSIWDRLPFPTMQRSNTISAPAEQVGRNDLEGDRLGIRKSRTNVGSRGNERLEEDNLEEGRDVMGESNTDENNPAPPRSMLPEIPKGRPSMQTMNSVDDLQEDSQSLQDN
eukprot:CAMPEP_0168412250 /NCGR_PEP_ID=MMETSP0228-20121227/28612_1 /TAXON_ID=133427 /ORGANISM="Protoceratium reticulatum, Strain CCCM 535 (=CCMP 1889)" /LENGTH=421 /DNA_ID=CAMNT_0008426007 /DNA_START=279 /DNA_END=1544 /DNA_ORIENTATION=-